MATNLTDARDRIELVRLLSERVNREAQPREDMRDQLKLAQAEIEIHLADMDRADKLRSAMEGDE